MPLDPQKPQILGPLVIGQQAFEQQVAAAKTASLGPLVLGTAAATVGPAVVEAAPIVEVVEDAPKPKSKK